LRPQKKLLLLALAYAVEGGPGTCLSSSARGGSPPETEAIAVVDISTRRLATTAAPPEPVEAASLGDFPDPFIMHEGNVYYAFATGAGSRNIQLARSEDLLHWSAMPDALPSLPAWAASQKGLTWGPAALRRRNQFILYYTTRDRASGFQCISRAVAPRPEGPYADTSESPFVCQVSGSAGLCGSIDPSPFLDLDGSLYLLWKSDENSAACRKPPRLWAQRMIEEGTGVVEQPVSLLSIDRPWEGSIVEGPSMILRDGRYFLFYSANVYDSAAYAIGYAMCAGPIGPCHKVSNEMPFLHSAEDAAGPGGQQFFDDGDGRLWMAYHAWTAAKTTYRDGGVRSLRLARMDFLDGLPVLHRRPNL
jgi:beta-xylosidase